MQTIEIRVNADSLESAGLTITVVPNGSVTIHCETGGLKSGAGENLYGMNAERDEFEREHEIPDLC